MAEDKKVKIVFEFDRKDYENYLFLADENVNEDTERLWQTMARNDILLSMEEMSKHMKLSPQKASVYFVAMAVLSVKDKVWKSL